MSHARDAAQTPASNQPARPSPTTSADVEIGRLATELHAANAALEAQRLATAASEARLIDLIDSLPDGLVTVDRTLRLTSLNAVAARLWQRDRDQLLSQPITAALPNIRSSDLYRALLAALDSGQPTLFEERSPAQTTWVSGRVAPTRDGAVVLIRGGSESPAGPLVVRDAEEPYRSLLDSIDIGFCIFEMILDDAGMPTDYRFLDANPIFTELTGLQDPIGKRALELVPGLDPFWVKTYGEVALTGTPARFEHGEAAMENRWFDVYACRIGDPAQLRVALLFTNVTERKRLERAQQDFVGMVSHDLGNPLAVVRGWAQILQRRGTYHAKGVAEIIEQTERMERLVADLGEFVQFEADLVELRRECADLSVIVSEAVARARLQAPARVIRLDLPAAPLLVDVDVGRIGQVLDNLLGNAIKYSPPVSPITVQVVRSPTVARLRVIDQGPGIPADAMPRLFDRFYRGLGSNSAQGVGLGLYLSRILVTAHGGRLTAESALGRGSTFTVELPLQSAGT
jgi:signal transduction histidine kinase